MNEMLNGNNGNPRAEDEEVMGNTTFVHVGGHPQDSDDKRGFGLHVGHPFC